MLLSALGRVGHSNKGDVGCCQSLGRFSTEDKCQFLPGSATSNLHPGPDINFTFGHLFRAEENVSAVAARTIHPHRVLAAVGRGAVERDFAALVAVRRVSRPCGRVQSFLEALGYLAEGDGKESKGENGNLVEHLADDKSTFRKPGEQRYFVFNLNGTTYITMALHSPWSIRKLGHVSRVVAALLR